MGQLWAWMSAESLSSRRPGFGSYRRRGHHKGQDSGCHLSLYLGQHKAGIWAALGWYLGRDLGRYFRHSGRTWPLFLSFRPLFLSFRPHMADISVIQAAIQAAIQARSRCYLSLYQFRDIRGGAAPPRRRHGAVVAVLFIAMILVRWAWWW